MNRRNILKGLGILSLGSLNFSSTAKVEASDLTKKIYYNGFKCLWKDWLCCVDSTKIVAQWLAVDTKRNIYIYSSYPGGSGQFFKGGFFDISTRASQKFLTTESNREEKEKAKEEAFQILKKEIDNFINTN